MQRPRPEDLDATVKAIVVKFKTFRIKFKKVQKSSRKNKVNKSS